MRKGLRPAERPSWHTGSVALNTVPDNKPMARLQEYFDPFKIILVILIAVAAFYVWSTVRSVINEPLDKAVTEQLCKDYGEEIGRSALGYERSNRFGLRNRSEGFCFFGEGPDGEAPITLTIEETQPGNRYRAAKWIGVIIQLGIVSIFLRFVVDPVMDTYRYIRSLISRLR